VKLVLTGLILAVLGSSGVFAREPQQSPPIGTVALLSLPKQGIETYQRIHRGGPFPFEKDGVVFGNREHLLPAQKRGYYLEYTVAASDSTERGIRRIVCGGVAVAPEACFYSADHYASFRRIVP
jgi:ribonuclease T1